MTKQELLNVFGELGFKTILDKELGELVVMSPLEAFLLSSTVGSNYLISPNGVSAKGRFEVFIHRSVFQNGYYIYSPGLFSRDINGFIKEGNSSFVLQSLYPQIFTGNKFIIIEDIPNSASSNTERSWFENITKMNRDPSNFILLKNYLSGSSKEPFIEYLAEKYYIKKGYVVENQVPWFQQGFKHKDKVINGGIPDFSAFHSSFCNQLYQLGYIGDEGISVNVLPVLRLFDLKKSNGLNKNYSYKLVVGEVKATRSSLGQALNQVNKYSFTNLPDEVFTIIPDVSNNGDNKIGELYIEDHQLKCNVREVDLEKNMEYRTTDNEWIDNYLKILLLGNVPFEDILNEIEQHRIITKQNLLSKYQAHHLLDCFVAMPNEDFYSFISKYI